MTDTIDGIVFSDMIKGALGELIIYEKQIDELNVFPVPDGDTGANMRRTLELGYQSAPQTEKLNEYVDKLSTGMLFGARGNSGVILSQIFKGLSVALSDKASATASDILDALFSGYITAYNTVVNPVEGTILTVLREGVNATKTADISDVESMLERLLSEMNSALEKTPEMLPVLKEAGVVDSGGFGLVKIIDGMLTAYCGGEVHYEPTSHADNRTLDVSAFDENSEFKFGYCMEFILQLQSGKIDVESFSKRDYTEEISAHGNSIVAIRDGSRVRVHIHTFTPETVISISRKYGEFVFFKMDNMALQHNETMANKVNRTAPRKALEIISVASGSNLAPLFTDLGSGITIGSPSDSSVSVQEFIDALESANADTVVILPNDKNAVQTAEQAVNMYKNDRVAVKIIPTKSAAAGYFALASDMPDSPAEERISAMADGAEWVNTVSVARCVHDRTNNGIKCTAGDLVTFVNGTLVNSGKKLLECAMAALRTVEDIDEKETALAFVGNVEGADELIERMGEEFPSLQIEVIDGAFSGEKLVIGIV